MTSPLKEGTPTSLVERLLDACVDYDGSQEVDGAPAVRIPTCGMLREAAALLAKLGQCPRPQIMGEHACKDRTQCWEPCGDLGHHEEYAKAAPGASDE